MQQFARARHRAGKRHALGNRKAAKEHGHRKGGRLPFRYPARGQSFDEILDLLGRRASRHRAYVG